MSAEDLGIFGTNLFGENIRPKVSGLVAQRFTMPPFSVLDAKGGDWQDRKRAWKSIGLASELGRECAGANAFNDLSMNPRTADSTQKIAAVGDGPTIFDPVLCELIYRWFCAEGSQVVDPFAGGSVRGIVAGALGRKYWGSDLRAEQIEANRAQADDIEIAQRPEWVCGDSRMTLTDAPSADLVFSCPPYGSLERYSDDEADLSSLSWSGFSIAYRLILTRAVAKLKPNRFAVFVVGNFRDTATGLYRDLVGETIAAMQQAGLGFYNDMVLTTSIGSASLRVSSIFDIGRKVCKVHQNVLVFVKGDWREAAKAARGD